MNSDNNQKIIKLKDLLLMFKNIKEYNRNNLIKNDFLPFKSNFYYSYMVKNNKLVKCIDKENLEINKNTFEKDSMYLSSHIDMIDSIDGIPDMCKLIFSKNQWDIITKKILR